MKTPDSRPKQDTKFKPGKSGNPGGRRRVWFDLKDALNRVGYVPGVAGNSAVELAVLTLVGALKGADRVPAAKTILAYGVGLPAQRVEIGNLTALSTEDLAGLEKILAKLTPEA